MALAPLVDVKPPIPGGDYTAVQNADGTWNVLDVPAFAEHVVTRGGAKQRVGRKWQMAAKERLDRRAKEDSYLPPLHVNHHGMGKQTSRAGFYRISDVRLADYQGEQLWTTFLELIAVPADVYAEIRRGGLPYRSVEIHDLDTPEIDSLALMEDEVPFFRLALLTIGREVPFAGVVGQPHQLRARKQPLRAYRALGSQGVQLLTRYG